MDLGLEGRRVVVTGAASGIGRATVHAYLAEGAEVVGAERGAAAPASESDSYSRVLVDLTAADAPTRLLREVERRWDGLDVLVNCAGIAPTRSSALSVPLDEWERTLAVNLLAPVRLVEALAPLLTDGSGVVVNVASTSARNPEPSLVDYAASKAALVAYTSAIAQELGPRGIRAVVVNPGSTRTELWDQPGGFVDGIADLYGLPPEEAVTHHVSNVRRIALERPGRAAEIADAIVYLTSKRAAFVNGTALAVHGGMATYAM